MKFTVLLLITVAMLAFVSATLANNLSDNYMLMPNVLASGGQIASSTNYSLLSTVGQAAIGQSSSASYSACSGFWCQVESILRIFLPLLLKSF